MTMFGKANKNKVSGYPSRILYSFENDDPEYIEKGKAKTSGGAFGLFYGTQTAN